MSETNWTPGPWHVVESDTAPRWWIVQDPETWVNRVAAVPAYALHADGTGCDSKANAQLIAAAPDLYAALDALVVELCDYMMINHLGDPEQKHNIKLARAAFAKARGQA